MNYPGVHRHASNFAPFVRGFVFAIIGILNLCLVAKATGQPLNDSFNVLAVLVFILLFTIFQRFSLSQRWKSGQPDSLGTRIFLAWLLVSAVLMFLGFLTRQTEVFPRRFVLIWLLSTPLFFFAAHVLIRTLTLRYFKPVNRARSAVVVFVNPASQHLIETLSTFNAPKFEPLGFFEDRHPQRIDSASHTAPILGPTQSLAEYVNRHSVEVVFVVLPAQGWARAMQIVEQLGDTCASVYFLPDLKLFNALHLQFSQIGGIPAFMLIETPFFGADGVLKRGMDIVFATALLLCMAPILLLVAAAIRLSMGSPIFFTQRRYGLDGRQIDVYKFRTMHVVENGACIRQASRDDPRVTPIGRFLRRTSIDELPQFLNVIKGDMSVVGPRPHAVAHNEEYRKLIKRYMVRHKVRPGLTGWAQVNGLRGEIRTLKEMQERVEYDLDYIVGWSPGFDIHIVMRTLRIIFRDEKAY